MRLAVAFVLVAMSSIAVAGGKPPVGAIAKLDRIVARVDRTPVWQSELDEVLVRGGVTTPTPEQTKTVLDELIDVAIIDHAAEELHIMTTDDEIDRAVDSVRKQNNLDVAAFDKVLAEQHFTRAHYRDELARALRSEKLYQLVLTDNITVSDAEISAAYAAAKAADPKIPAWVPEMKDVFRERVWTTKKAAEQQQWLDGRRKLAHVERR